MRRIAQSMNGGLSDISKIAITTVDLDKLYGKANKEVSEDTDPDDEKYFSISEDCRYWGNSDVIMYSVIRFYKGKYRDIYGESKIEIIFIVKD